MSLADTLLDDFSEDDFKEKSDVENELLAEVNHNNNFNIQELLTISDLNSIISIKDYCPILSKLKNVNDKLDKSESSQLFEIDNSILMETSNMITEIYNYFNILNSFIKLAYQNFWPDLSNIIKNPLFYIKIIKIINFNLKNFKNHIEKDDLNFLSKDLILSLTMSSNFLIKSNQSVIPNNHIQTLILESCDIMNYINEIQLKFRTFIIKRVEKIAPNLTSLVGTTVATQLISSTGLSLLSITPACNIPSLGKSINKNSLGYIYQCDIVKNISNDFTKQAVRQLCSKIVLCARMDQSKPENGNMGLKWKQEIEKRLDKLILPPENVRIKPLAKPIDIKSKKRGGRKFKKMRERMKMSEIEKAQNKMMFGEEELTKTDAFGEEIGLGMLGKTSIRNTDDVRGVHVTKSTKKELDMFSSSNKNKNSEEGESKLASLLD